MNGQPEFWTANTLQRTTGQAFRTLQRARKRTIEYPSIRHAKPVIKESMGHSTLDDAFNTVMISLSAASKSCLCYYRSSSVTDHNNYDKRFCAKYLTSKSKERRRKHPLQDEEMDIVVAPGTYRVTAATLGQHGTSQQTHVIKVGKGETAAVDFTI